MKRASFATTMGDGNPGKEVHVREKRKAERQILTTFTPVYDYEKDGLLGYLRDLNLRGAKLVGSKPMETQEEMTLAIEFQEIPEIPATRMVIPARVAWCLHEENSDYYNTGIEFLEVRPEDEKVIQTILQRYQFRQDPPDYPLG